MERSELRREGATSIREIADPNGLMDVPQSTKYRSATFPDVPIHAFADEAAAALSPGATDGFVTLDLSDRLLTPYPATTPLMLCRYLVLRPGRDFVHSLLATGEVFYVIRGDGMSHGGGRDIAWSAGDLFCFPGGGRTEHRSTDGAILFLCTDEPALAYLGVQGIADPPVLPAHFQAREIDAALAAIYTKNEPHLAAGKALNFCTRPMAASMSMMPVMTVAMNSLEPGGNQRPHRHNATAVTLGIETDGVFSRIGGRHVDWAPYTAVVTPPGLVHSHHNRGHHDMRALAVQDGGLHYYCRTGMFEHVDAPDAHPLVVRALQSALG